ncbi:biotin transporter BioY [Paenibacillus sp. GCM10023252]|uniref:biotin transporter BioY n=1 Tax=Paenibacillus sp. GCM10023252 TaxID=3252649 RepID=UPI00360F5B99
MSSNIRSIVYIALFAAIFVVMSSITIKIGSPVPITLQTLGVILAGAFLGPRNGFLSLALVVVLTAIGLPLLHGNGGLSTVLGPTGGFIFAFPFTALFIGFAARAIMNSKLAAITGNRVMTFLVLFAAFEIIGLFAYVPGVPWLIHVLDWSFQEGLAKGMYPFLIGDALKALLAAVIVIALKPYIYQIQDSTRPASSSSSPTATHH